MNDPIDRQAAIDALDEIESEVADGYGYQYEKWRKYFCELPSAQPEEAISVAWLEEQAKWFESMDNAFAKIEANNIRVMIKKYRSERNV